MSVTAMGRVFWTKFPPLSYCDKKGKVIQIKASTAKLVLLAIADNCDDFGENSYQSFDTLAEKTDIDRRSVIRVARALLGSGLIRVEGLSVYGTNNYSIVMDKLGEAPKKRPKKGRPKNSDSESLNFRESKKSVTPSQKLSDSVTETSDSVTETSDSESPESLLNRPLPIHKPKEDGELKNLFLKASEIVFSDVLQIHTLETVTEELERASFFSNGNSLIVSGLPGDRPAFYQGLYKTSFERAFIGILGKAVSIDFTGSGDEVAI